MRATLALALSFVVIATPLAAQADSTNRGGRPRQPDLPLAAARTVNIDTDEGTWISLDVSPDGRTIVFDLLGDLYTIPMTGGAATQLTNGMAFDAQPRFSPDGKLVVFTSDRDGGDNVWTIDVASKATKQITKGKTTGRYRSPEWTPDGNYIVVSRAAASIGTSKLWMYHKDGGQGIQLIRDPQPLPNGAFQVTTLGAAFGKDDRYIWYAQRSGAWEYNAGMPQYSLQTLDRRTGRREQRAAMYGSAFRPALSSDGKYLVYGARYENQTGLRIRDMETLEERWLAYPVQRDEQESVASMDVLPGYSFTPDNRAVVASYGGKIWSIPVDGTAPTNIPFRVQTQLSMGPKVAFNYRIPDSAEFTVRQIRDAVPSPDEKRLAFVAMDRLYIMDYPSGTPRRVSDIDGNEAQPAWSPDGQWLAYVVWTRTGGQLYRVRTTVPNSRPVAVLTANAYYADPQFSPDGTRILFARRPAQTVMEQGGFQGATELMWVPVLGGRPTLIAPSEGRAAPHFVDADTGRIYYFGGGQGLVSVRWDGTDPRTHIRVTGLRTPEAPQPANAGWMKMSPRGGEALVQVQNDLYVIQVPEVGEAPTINMQNPDNAEVPSKRLTDVGGQFPAWSKDGHKVHWSIGHSHFVYDLDRAKVVEARRDATPRSARPDRRRTRAGISPRRRRSSSARDVTSRRAPRFCAARASSP
jgi:Tol biopolymer transport system component